jgi:hypothetical protein
LLGKRFDLIHNKLSALLRLSPECHYYFTTAYMSFISRKETQAKNRFTVMSCDGSEKGHP